MSRIGRAMSMVSVMIVLATGASAKVILLDAYDSGWYRSDGVLQASDSLNYVAGRNGHTYRDFFVFDLTQVVDPIVGADLHLYNPGYLSEDPYETYQVMDVETDPTQVMSGLGNPFAIYDDLGSGDVYGSRNVSKSDEGGIVNVSFAGSGLASLLADLNAARGGFFAIGGQVSSISGEGASERIFAYSGDPEFTKQLALTTKGESTVPDGSSTAMLLACALCGLTFLRKTLASA
jgi:hypothetical protein